MESVLRIETGWPAKPLSPNARPHWSTKRRAEKVAKHDAYFSTYAIAPRDWAKGAEAFAITIHAEPDMGRRRDRDNLVASAKPFLDGIALALGVDDSLFRTPVVEWGPRHPGGRLLFDVERQP